LVRQDTDNNPRPPSMPVSFPLDGDLDAEPRVAILMFQFLRSRWWYGADARLLYFYAVLGNFKLLWAK
jgi:hypothetical protein